MTNDLDRLIEAVDAGTLDARACGAYGSAISPHCDGETITLVTPLNAYHGDLNAAVALLEALLPGWEWAVYGRGTAHLWKQLDNVNADNSIPARALLLAVLRAKLMEMENEH